MMVNFLFLRPLFLGGGALLTPPHMFEELEGNQVTC